MLEDRYYMRGSSFDARRSATMMLLIANVAAFVLECILYGYPPRFRFGDPLALSWYGLSHGYVWQLLTFQFLHGGLLHLLVNCLVIYMFGRELEEALGVKRFLTLYFGSGVAGGLLQAAVGGLAQHFTQSVWLAHFGGPTVGASAGALGLIAAFAMMYPERPLTLLVFFVIPVTMRAKYLLVFSALIALFGLVYAAGNIADAAHLGGILFGIVFVRYAMHWDWHWPRLRLRRREAPRRLVKVKTGSSTLWNTKTVQDVNLPAEEFLSREVDPILDKISAHGIQSLTERERRILETARERMGKR